MSVGLLRKTFYMMTDSVADEVCATTECNYININNNYGTLIINVANVCSSEASTDVPEKKLGDINIKIKYSDGNVIIGASDKQQYISQDSDRQRRKQQLKKDKSSSNCNALDFKPIRRPRAYAVTSKRHIYGIRWLRQEQQLKNDQSFIKCDSPVNSTDDLDDFKPICRPRTYAVSSKQNIYGGKRRGQRCENEQSSSTCSASVNSTDNLDDFTPRRRSAYAFSRSFNLPIIPRALALLKRKLHASCFIKKGSPEESSSVNFGRNPPKQKPSDRH